MVLPGLSDFRDLAKLVAVKARGQIGRGQFDEAIKTLQVGFALGGHVAEGETLIHGLLGISIHALMLKQVEELVQAEGCPNLYWALTRLPRPPVDMRQSLETERSMVGLWWPELRELKTTVMTPARAREVCKKVLGGIWEGLTGGNARITGQQLDLMAAGITLTMYPHAKEALLKEGRSAGEVEAMPAGQVVLLAMMGEYATVRDDMCKWFSVPYAEARGGLARAEARLVEQRKRSGDMPFPRNWLLDSLLALGRAYCISARLERDVAMLRGVELVRLYAARHGGALPATLAEVSEGAAPVDPLWGRALSYRVEGGKGIIESLAPEGQPAENGLIYEVSIRR